MRSKGLAIVGTITLALAPTADSEGVAADFELPPAAQAASLQAQVTALQAIVAELVEQQRCHKRPNTVQADSDGNYAGGVDWRGCDKTGLSMWGVLVGGGLEIENLTNADLREVNFTKANLIGIQAGGANLEGATFINASLAYSNFQGANVITLDVAQQYGRAETVFINTTCPDTTNSDDHGGTCAGHMIP